MLGFGIYHLLISDGMVVGLLWCDHFVSMGFFVVSATGFPVLVFGFTSECHTLQLNAVFSVKSRATGFLVLVRSKFELCALSVPRL